MTENYVGDYVFTVSADTKLGQGTYANVFKGRHRLSHEVVAIKAINFDEKSSQDQKYLKQEISVMMELNHPNTIRMYAHMKIGPIMYVVMEYCAGRDLRTFLDKQPAKRLPEDYARHFMCQITSGLRYLHEKGIIHRDLKPQNILLSEDSPTAALKICDFGFARLIEPQMTSILGSPLYMAPEIMMGRPYTAKSDLWSVGCIFYEMLVGGTPLRPTSLNHLRQLVSDSNPISYPPDISDHCKDLIHGLLQKKSSDRYDWTQFLSHPYLQRNEPTSKQAWLQHIYVFFPQGSIVTLYVKPVVLISAMKGALQNLTGVPIHEQLLIDNEGQVLQDHLSLEFYRFDQVEKPIYSIFWPILRGEELPLPPFQLKYEIPYPVSINYSDLSYNLPINSITDLHKVRDFWQRVGAELQNRSKNIKARLENVKAFNFQHDYQQEVYKILRNHVFRVGNDLKQEQRSVIELYEAIQINVKSISSTYHQMVEELKKTSIHPGLVPILKANTLLQLVDEKKVSGFYQIITSEFEGISKNVNLLKDSITKIRDDIDKIERTKLDENSLKELQSSVTTLGSILNDVKTFLSNYQDSLRTAGQRINEIVALPHIRNENSYANVAQSFSETVKLSTLVLNSDDKSLLVLDQAQKVKINCTLEMMKNFGPIGKVMLNSQNINKLFVAIRGAINQIQPIINEMRAISKLSSAYKDYVTEIIRRKSFDERNKKLTLSFQSQTQSELQSELVKRRAFQELNGTTIHLKPLSLLLNKPSQSPTVTIPNEDIILPDLGAIPTLEDDFCFVEEGTPEERLKRLEKEKGELSETLSAITKELTTAKQTIEDQTKQLSSLNNIISSNSLKVQPTPPPDNEPDVKILREVNSKLMQEIQTLRKKNQLLVSEIDTHSLKIKDYEQRITVLENSSPDIKRLLDMGFQIELVRKALAANSSVENAVQWLLESSQL